MQNFNHYDCEISLEDEMLQIHNFKPKSNGLCQKVKSRATCELKKIKGFTYGPFSSRFWMLRKHINSIPLQEKKKPVFHAWQCITIQTEQRDVDLVIQKDEDMFNLLSFLVFELQTLDGRRGTASRVFGKVGHLRQTISNKVIFKLKIMKWRMKISFMARSQKKTVKELFLSAILASYCMLFL